MIIKILLTIIVWIILHFIAAKIEKVFEQIGVIQNDYKSLLIGDIVSLIIVFVLINKLPFWAIPIIYIGGFFGGHWGGFTNYVMHGSRWWLKKKKIGG